jgi:hypothetical protein
LIAKGEPLYASQAEMYAEKHFTKAELAEICPRLAALKLETYQLKDPQLRREMIETTKNLIHRLAGMPEQRQFQDWIFEHTDVSLARSYGPPEYFDIINALDILDNDYLYSLSLQHQFSIYERLFDYISGLNYPNSTSSYQRSLQQRMVTRLLAMTEQLQDRTTFSQDNERPWDNLTQRQNNDQPSLIQDYCQIYTENPEPPLLVEQSTILARLMQISNYGLEQQLLNIIQPYDRRDSLYAPGRQILLRGLGETGLLSQYIDSQGRLTESMADKVIDNFYTSWLAYTGLSRLIDSELLDYFEGIGIDLNRCFAPERYAEWFKTVADKVEVNLCLDDNGQLDSRYPISIFALRYTQPGYEIPGKMILKSLMNLSERTTQPLVEALRPLWSQRREARLFKRYFDDSKLQWHSQYKQLILCDEREYGLYETQRDGYAIPVPYSGQLVDEVFSGSPHLAPFQVMLSSGDRSRLKAQELSVTSENWREKVRA